MPADVQGTWLHTASFTKSHKHHSHQGYKSWSQHRLWSNSVVYTKLLFWDECFYFSILSADPPKITQHPKHQSVSLGADVAFTLEAIGDDDQRQKDGKDIDRNASQLQYGQTDKSSTLSSEKSDKGHYGCLVKNPVESSEKTSHTAKHTDCKYSLVCIQCWIWRCYFFSWWIQNWFRMQVSMTAIKTPCAGSVHLYWYCLELE